MIIFAFIYLNNILLSLNTNHSVYLNDGKSRVTETFPKTGRLNCNAQSKR